MMRPPESFVGQPVRSLQTMLRFIAAHHRELPSVIPDGIYGQQTAAAVSAFQRKYGIPVTGIADQATWELIVSVYRPALTQVTPAQPLQVILEPSQVIRQGERHHSIYLAQAMLIELSEEYQGLPRPEVSGTLDSATSEALCAFQRMSGLPSTGSLDKITWKHLVQQFELSAGDPVPVGDSPQAEGLL